jgi:hypothetical protein
MILEPTNTVESNPSQPEIPTAETNQSPAANIAPGTETPTEMETPINESPRSETQPPVRDVVQRSDADVVAPSPLTTLDSSSAYEQQNQVSIHQIRFEQAENGVSLSVPVANDYVFPSNNNVDTYTDGLDSDGEVGPFFDAVAEEKDYSDEEDENEDIGIGGPVQVVPPSTDAPLIPPITATGNDATLPSLTEVEVMAMTVNQLKDELAKRKLSKNGVKATLQQRLIGAMTTLPNTAIESADDAEGPQTAAAVIEGFDPSAKWRELVHNEVPVEEPTRPNYLRGPTVPTNEDEFPKFNFDETWDRPPFSAMSEVVKLGQRQQPLKDRRGKVLYEKEIRTEGRANLQWLNKHKLTKDSEPHEWFEALLPIKPTEQSSVSICQWTQFANMRALLMNAGTAQYYKSFKPFTPEEYKQFMALYIFQGLCPSPRISMKFVPQSEDPIQGNDLCFKIFGRRGKERHKEWKAFAVIQDPKKVVPPRKTHPNFKVDLFLTHMQKVSIEAWDCGQHLSGDEQTIGFKGNHCDKQRVSYKREGDGFLADAICDSGYTYTFYFRNVPAPKQYIDRKCSALHSRMLFLFDTLKDKYHDVGMDNLYLSLKFAREAFTGKNQVMMHGVTRRTGRGLPSSVIQNEEKNQKKAEQIRGTTKAAVLEGDPNCPNVVAFSVYDTKPVHFLSTNVTHLRWIEKQKKNYDSAAGQCILMKFLRPNIVDQYTMNMNGVDIADQLRNYYRIDRWMRKRKWWWSIWWWGIQVLLVNAYVLYRTAHIHVWKQDKKSVMTQYNFRYQIVLAWLGMRPKKEDASRKQPIDSICSSVTSRETLSIKKARPISNFTLDPATGLLKGRLDSNFHFIVPSQSKYPVCALCRWANSDEDNDRSAARVRGKSIGTCDVCNVNLCLKCFKIFHTVGNLDKLRSEVRKE